MLHPLQIVQSLWKIVIFINFPSTYTETVPADKLPDFVICLLVLIDPLREAETIVPLTPAVAEATASHPAFI